MFRVSKLACRLAVAGFLAIAVAGKANAELPPGSYNALRAGAGEVLIVEVTKAVTTTVDGPNTVTLTAKVLHADKSSTKLKAGSEITIQYVTPKAGVPIMGPRQPMMLAKGDVRVAYLRMDPKTKKYSLAAHGMSFTADIEKVILN